jgi:hypothetical protein
MIFDINSVPVDLAPLFLLGFKGAIAITCMTACMYLWLTLSSEVQRRFKKQD